MVSQKDRTADLSALKARSKNCLQDSLSFDLVQRSHKSHNKRASRLTDARERTLIRGCAPETRAAFSWRERCGSTRIDLCARSGDWNEHGWAVSHRYQAQVIEQPIVIQPGALAG